MKKMLFIAAIACLTTVSCKKEYTCECTATSGQTGSTISATASTTIKDKKADAKTACENGSFDNSTGNIVSKTECKIK